MFRKYMLPLLALALVAWSVWNVFGAPGDKNRASGAGSPPGSPFVSTVAGSGIVEPATLKSGTVVVAVGENVTGVVTEVGVKAVGEWKAKGNLLFKLDDRVKRAELAVKKQNLALAEAQLRRVERKPRPVEIAPYQREVEAARAVLKGARDAYDRARAAGSAVAPGELVKLRQEWELARKKYQEARDKLALLKAGASPEERDQARAAVEQARAGVEQAKTDLEVLKVRAPFDGWVVGLNVQEGERVNAQPGKAPVQMGAGRGLHLRVQIDASEIGRFRKEARAVAKTRGQPPMSLPLKFVRLEPYVVPKRSLTGDNTERVDTRVLEVIYEIETPTPFNNLADAPVHVGDLLDVYIDAGGGPK
jgi:multidrug efflux pump subunit AcrA (membrane-fusion protein)